MKHVLWSALLLVLTSGCGKKEPQHPTVPLCSSHGADGVKTGLGACLLCAG